MKRIIVLALAVLLLSGLCACAAQQPSADVPSDKETASAPMESSAETKDNSGPSETEKESELAVTQAEPQTDPEPTETQTEPRSPEPETKTVSLTLPFMNTEDFVSFWPEDGARSAGLSLEIPADWTEDAGLFYCPLDGGVRKVMEPVCLLKEMDDVKWAELAQFDLTQPDGETEYLSVTSGVDANGRDYIWLLGKSWPEGGTISVWYPCFCYLRDTTGTTVVLTYYLMDPEAQAAKEELVEIIDSIRIDY